MQTRFLLGPAGSGKTFRCLAEIRAALKASPEGPPLILLAPKQATFQLERQLLADDSLPGYTRLQILSFERLAHFILENLQCAPSELLSEEGRVMVLRSLLSQHKGKLKIFHASARLPGFARQLSLLLRDLQTHQISPAALLQLVETLQKTPQLSAKLHDLALLLGAYFDWLKEHELQDGNRLLDLAAEALDNRQTPPAIQIDGLWLDGFAEMTAQEINLLAAVIPYCQKATLAFCLDSSTVSENKTPALSIWSLVHKTFQDCLARLQTLAHCETKIEILPRDATQNRFSESAPLRHLEKYWSTPKPFPMESPEIADDLANSIRLTTGVNHEAEAVLAAHEILQFVRKGGRFRSVAVLLRQFDGYHEILRRVFSRYEIPFFLDRRESIANHLLAQLTRSALRLVAFGWEHDDLFCALKTGLVTTKENLLDQLENESLARGWKKEAWLQPLKFSQNEISMFELEKFRQSIIPVFQRFHEALAALKNFPNGLQLATAIRGLWDDLNVEEQLLEWSQLNPVHVTALAQMRDWLENIERAFSHETMRVSDWIPILESGLSGMTAGIIPPALDQVLIGTIDRSRNPDLELVVILGANETVFPAPPKLNNLLNERDHDELSKHDLFLAPNKLESLGRERFYGYIACTRSRKRLVLSCAAQDNEGRALNPSPFFNLFAQLFPTLKPEPSSGTHSWFESQHSSELFAPLIQARTNESVPSENQFLLQSSALISLRREIEHFSALSNSEKISPEMVEQLYGTTLKTSVSALEQYAACPFRFFISSGLRAEERRVFEADVREKGSFQHAILRKFHDDLASQNQRWRDISISDARTKIAQIGEELKTSFREGLFTTDAQNDFAARHLTASLQDFIEATVGWMRQYEFDPHGVEISFGTAEKVLPAWEIDLDDTHRMAFRGIIDRVDLCRLPNVAESMAVVIDYKSSAKQLDPLSLAHGLQLQLPAYLAFLRHLPQPEKVFGVEKLVPAGVFFVNLRGAFSGGKTRGEVLDSIKEERQNAYQHAGRFDFASLKYLDNRNVERGTQFNYRLKKDGQPHGASREIMATEDFTKLLDDVERHLIRVGKEIFSGNAKIDPYQKGNVRACEQCDYATICRIDPWTHEYRVLKKNFAHAAFDPINTHINDNGRRGVGKNLSPCPAQKSRL